MLTFKIKFNYILSSNPPEARFCEEEQAMVVDFDADSVLSESLAALNEGFLKAQLMHLLNVLVPNESIVSKADWSYNFDLSPDLSWEKRTFTNGECFEGYGIACALNIISKNLQLSELGDSKKVTYVLQDIAAKRLEYLKALFYTRNAFLKNFEVIYSGDIVVHPQTLCIFELDDLIPDPNPAAAMLFAYGLNPSKLMDCDIQLDISTQSILCNLTKVIMSLPTRDRRFPSQPCVDFEAYKKYIDNVGKNPFNRQPITLQDLIIDYDLMAKIGQRLNTIKLTIPLRLCIEKQQSDAQEIKSSEQITYNALMAWFLAYKESLAGYQNIQKQLTVWEAKERQQIMDIEPAEKKAAASKPKGTCLRIWQEKEEQSRQELMSQVESKFKMFAQVKSRLRARKVI